MSALDAIQSPFQRLRDLLGDTVPGKEPIDMTIGEPRHAMPDFLSEKLAEDAATFGKYPPISGTAELRDAIALWHERRYGHILSHDEIMILCGSREGLASAIILALVEVRATGRDKVLMPNPFYQAYAGAAIAGGGTPVYLTANAESGHLPCLDTIEADAATLREAAVLILCSPANPQGAVADKRYLARAAALCRAAGTLLFVDECYSEVYPTTPPPGILETVLGTGGTKAGVLAFNSLSKRSNVPGLRSGFAAGDPEFIARLGRFRNVAGPQMPLPIQHASAALWRDEDHVAISRSLYREKFGLADQYLGPVRDLIGYQRPQGGFFLWLDMGQFGGGENASVTLWKHSGVKLLPGAFLSQPDDRGSNPGGAFVRLALVHDMQTTEEALKRIAAWVLE